MGCYMQIYDLQITEEKEDDGKEKIIVLFQSIIDYGSENYENARIILSPEQAIFVAGQIDSLARKIIEERAK